MQLPWWKDQPKAAYFKNNNMDLFANADWVSARISEYLQVGVIRQVNLEDMHCCLPLKVVVTGATQKKRLIWVGCYVNDFIKIVKFHYETIQQFLTMLQRDDYLGKVDAASGYHTIRIHTQFQKFLGFSWGGRFYVYQVLPFGMNVAPLIYTVVILQLTKFWRRNSLLAYRGIQYLDDGSWASRSMQQWFRVAFTVILTVQDCGFWLGLDKCSLDPVCALDVIEFWINTKIMIITLPEKRNKRSQITSIL